ncbi:MAG: DUF4062 domain-containing protein [Phycisphaerae bacterium]|nr:DUF4062 domain-containing protein [Phycisphaerae bacterium]
MADSVRPEIFVIATSRDLGSCRAIVAKALATLGCVAIEQTAFPPEASTVREMLRSKIDDCDAVIHVAGEIYGFEPQERGPDEERRSYTQLEVDIARELGKPVYVFVCGEGFPYDVHKTEDEERCVLQRAHREKLQSSAHLFYLVASREQLENLALALQLRTKEI